MSAEQPKTPLAQREIPNWAAALLLATIVAAVVGWTLLRPDPTAGHVPLPEVLQAVTDGTPVTYDEPTGTITATLDDGTQIAASVPARSADPILERLLDAGAALDVDPVQPPGTASNLLVAGAPMLLLFTAAGLYLYTKSSGNKVIASQRPTVRLADVIGADEAVEEAGEIVAFLRDSGRFDAVGAKPPTGVLLVGPPGVGKTLLAKAIAGETQTPFFQISGSDFVEMIAGLGARRVRNLIAAARKAAKDSGGAIVFIDELDAVGRRRGQQIVGGGDREAEQTLNALLVALDGFDGRDGVVVLAATNRPDVLDPALTRPGRFDRKISFGLPDLHARTQLLEQTLARLLVPAAEDHQDELAGRIDLGRHARRLAGASGADIVNLVNQAAINAARQGNTHIHNHHLDDAWDRLAAGSPRPNAIVHPDDRHVTAVHEAGHATIGLLDPDAPNPTKVSIIPHGAGAGGITVTDGTDRTLLTRAAADARLRVAMAGRAAEALIYGPDKVTNGASSDIAAATRLAKAMVTEWGWGTLGTINLDELGTDNRAADRVAAAIASLLDTALEAATDTLNANRDTLDTITDMLLERDTITSQDLAALTGPPTTGNPTPVTVDRINPNDP